MGIRVGVAGVGRLGREHVRVLAGLDGVDGVACFDTRLDRARAAAAEYAATAFDDLDELIGSVDAVVVAVPTITHCDVAVRAIDRGRDVFIEKPIAAGRDEARRIVDAAEEHACILQVGHVERFNGALEAVMPRIGKPAFVEIHRLAPFNVRGTDVSVVGDLMIHDLDLLCHILHEWPSEIRAAGAAILTDAADIVNARLEYPGGCVANVTASRMTVTPMRKLRIFSDDRYVSIDLLNARATLYRKSETFEAGMQSLRSSSTGRENLKLGDFVEMESIRGERAEPLQKELRAFCRCIETREPPPVTGDDGLKAVALAEEILSCLNARASG